MPALIGYLVALAVFLGGGYAGMQWLTAPEDIPSAVAVHRSIEPVKSTRARLLARKRHEAAAEREANSRPIGTALPAQDEAVPPTVESVAVAADAAPATVNEVVQRRETRKPIAVADAPIDRAKVVSLSPPAPQNMALPATQQPMLANVPPAARAAAIVGGRATTTAATPTKAGLPPDNRATATPEMAQPLPDRSVTERTGQPKSVEKKADRPILARDYDEATGSRLATVIKRRAATRLASRKPVMMILRTIEFPDGRREQRLLPMPRYRQAFAED